MLALETGFPIVPVAVRGSGTSCRAARWRARPATIEVVVGEPDPVAGASRDELMERVADVHAPARSHRCSRRRSARR